MGGLVASVAYGRNVADVEALRIAHQYRENDLLKGLPIPRLRLSRVSINLPIIIAEVIPGTAPVKNKPSEIARLAVAQLKKIIEDVTKEVKLMIARKNLSDADRKLYQRYERLLITVDKVGAVDMFHEELVEELQDAFMKLDLSEGGSSASDASIRNAAAETAEVVFRDVLREVNFVNVEQRVATENKARLVEEQQEFDPDRARQSIEEVMGHDLYDRMRSAVRLAAKQSAVIKPTTSPDFFVSVDTDEIKNAGGGPNSVTRLSIDLLEEGLEWLHEQRDGQETSTLIPE